MKKLLALVTVILFVGIAVVAVKRSAIAAGGHHGGHGAFILGSSTFVDSDCSWAKKCHTTHHGRRHCRWEKVCPEFSNRAILGVSTLRDDSVIIIC